MGSRRLLASVADGTARAFASRNNDVDGWWVPGLLLEVLPPGDPDYRLDLLTGAATPEPLEPALRQLGPAWAIYFAWTLHRHALASGVVRSAVLTLRFDRDRLVRSYVYEAHARPLDHPFTCRVEVTDDRDRVHVSEVEDHCGRRADFTDPNPWHRPRQAGGLNPGPRVLGRVSHAPPTS